MLQGWVFVLSQGIYNVLRESVSPNLVESKGTEAKRVQLVPERVKTLTTFLTSRSPYKMQGLA